jgi:hypothetical protein
MERFSIRQGFKAQNVIQSTEMDDDLRNCLWNTVYINLMVFDKHDFQKANETRLFLGNIWLDFLKLCIDDFPKDNQVLVKALREYFFNLQWHEVYDLLEFIANNTDNLARKHFIESCNYTLETECSAYRFVGTEIVSITSKEETKEIDDALTNPLNQVTIHIQTALEMLSDRTNPDYRNSIKESISAVESICNLITDRKNPSLSEALKLMQPTFLPHRAFKDALEKLYGYTSDADGIRHSLFESSNLDFEDAKFMLVSCSAFVNYLTVKATKSSITFGKKPQTKIQE